MARTVTGWVGWVWFGAFCLLTVGLFNVVSGLIAVFSEEKVLAWSGQGVTIVDVSTWGWVHLILGAAMVALGLVLFTGAAWARWTASVLVVLNLVAQFVSLPITPWWSLAVIVLDVVVLWALIVHGEEVERAVS
ncbi:DUF7144 family membrane protein [Cellulomonas septica]|uniref:DUF7144 domain-containing protein n=1 Tax=Cellulomonas septica TaxID=285080 RepID=A0ABX1K0E5_9CELL|nr:hypothetical protein [Cellulomonas septica]NKY39706.1 hypothetical protein [Cellulomonas septica]